MFAFWGQYSVVRASRGQPAGMPHRVLPSAAPLGHWTAPTCAPSRPPAQCPQAEAERRLLFAALADRRNQRFVLLSETCAPLYPPHVLYTQLLSETKSRVNACAPPDGHVVDRCAGRLCMRPKLPCRSRLH